MMFAKILIGNLILVMLKKIKMPLLIFSQLDYLTQIVDINSHT